MPNSAISCADNKAAGIFYKSQVEGTIQHAVDMGCSSSPFVFELFSTKIASPPHSGTGRMGAQLPAP